MSWRPRLPSIRQALLALALLAAGRLVLRRLARPLGEVEERGAGAGARIHRVGADGELEIHLPAPSIWPAVLGAGVALLLFGVVTSLAFSALGALLLVWALGGWIGELRRG